MPITLVIESSGAGTGRALVEALPGHEATGTAPVSHWVEAELTGPKDIVEITPRSDMRQLVSQHLNPTWIWDVKAKDMGTVYLTIAVFPIGDGKRTPGPHFVEQFPVTIGVEDWIIYQGKKFAPIWGGILAVLAAWSTYKGVIGPWFKRRTPGG